MYSRLRLLEKYLRFYARAANGKGHGIHSPFVYDLVRNVLLDRTAYAPFAAIEGLRKKLLRDKTELEVVDLGTGSVDGVKRVRTIAEIAGRSAKPRRLGQLLFRLARYYRPRVLVELGTSLGLSTAYLAGGMKDGEGGDQGLPCSGGGAGNGFWTIEGSAAIAARAAIHLLSLGSSNVEVLTGSFEDRLGPLLQTVGPVEFAFIDGNHRHEPTMRYFEQLLRRAATSAMFVFDDIHWSAEMEKAWDEIRADGRVMMTIDLFYLGLVVFRESFQVKQDFTIRF